MSDFPGADVPTPPAVNTWSFNSALSAVRVERAYGLASVTWVANLAIYIPVLIPWPYQVRRVFWVNGGTVASSNADFGIYTAGGTKIYSTGSTAMSGASVPQFVTPTAFLLSPGAYYFAWACDNTTNRGHGNAVAAVSLRMAGVLQQATAFPLPATMTGATVTNALYPLCGISRLASSF